MTSTAARPRWTEVDGLRGIAILLVVVFHFFALPTRHAAVPRSLWAYSGAILEMGWTGVDLFFVLSGFLIGGILIDERGSPNFFSAFYARRAYRILPPYIAICGMFLVVASLATGRAVLQPLVVRAIPWGYVLTLTQNFWMGTHGGSPFLGVTWSLAVEEQFYLAVPFAVRWLAPRHLANLVVGVLVLAPLTRIWVYVWHPAWPMAPYTFPFCRADALMMGVGVALALRNERAWQAIIARRRQVYVACAVLSAGIAALIMARLGANHVVTVTIGYSWIAAFYAVVLVIALMDGGRGRTRILRLQMFRTLGRLAYSTYLLHIPVSALAFALVLRHRPQLTSRADATLYVASVAMTLGLAQLSWWGMERHMIARGHRHRYRDAD